MTKAVCPAVTILTLLSKRHMLLILHTLTGKPKGFNDLQEALDVNTATLTRRLRELENENIVEILPCPNDSRAHYYSLTVRGKKMSKLIDRFAKI